MPYDKKSFILGLATGLATRGILCNPAKKEQQGVAYLTFSSPEPFTLAVYNAAKNWDGTLEYSTDTTNWTVWDGATTLASGTMNSLYLRGKGNTVITGILNDGWVLAGADITCTGDIRVLLDYTDPDNTVMARYCFTNLFYGCTSLIGAPELPATTLASGCYSSMFYGCTGLMNAPALPATTLASGCYNFMLYGCTSLISIPKLPATTLASNCYRSMLHGCINIKLSTAQIGEYQTPYRLPSSGTGTTATNALTNMFANTGGTFTGTPEINATYYTANEAV